MLRFGRILPNPLKNTVRPAYTWNPENLQFCACAAEIGPAAKGALANFFVPPYPSTSNIELEANFELLLSFHSLLGCLYPMSSFSDLNKVDGLEQLTVRRLGVELNEQSGSNLRKADARDAIGTSRTSTGRRGAFRI